MGRNFIFRSMELKNKIMYEIKTELLQICEAFNLGSFISSLSHSREKNGFILTTFETSKGIYKHYFKIKTS